MEHRRTICVQTTVPVGKQPSYFPRRKNYVQTFSTEPPTMAIYERLESIEIEVLPKAQIQMPLKQNDLLEDLLRLQIIAGLPKGTIEGFQRNTDGTFTVTLNTVRNKTIFMTFLSKIPTMGEYIYYLSSVDMVGGRLTIQGAPNEYPNHKIHAALSNYVDIVKIKNGACKAHPEVRNGVKHVTFKKMHKLYPSQLKLPKGFQVRIKMDGAEANPRAATDVGGPPDV